MRVLPQAIVGMFVIGAAGCSLGANGAAPRPSGAAILTVTPARGLWDVPAYVRVSRLRTGARVAIRVVVTDGAGTAWSSQAEFVADVGGVVDLARRAPVGGAYRVADLTGLVSTLKPRANTGSYYFPRPGDRSERLRFDLVERGRVIASARVTRTLQSATVSMRHVSLAREGVLGDYFAPRGVRKRPAVLVFGGSEGGLAIPAQQAALVASRGVPALALAYFHAPGLPPHLDRIPLEYFVRGLRWLARQPAVDRRRVVVWSGSRGSEAALLVAAHFPALVHGVIVTSPSALVNGALGGSRVAARRSAWTLDGKGLTFARIWNDLSPIGADARAIIPVERIRGPVLTVAGERDKLWDSSAFAAAIQRRLIHHHDPWPHTSLDYPNAGHFIDIAIPSTSAAIAGEDPGGDPASDGHARFELWPHILAFLRPA